jgi:hypothetical protein
LTKTYSFKGWAIENETTTIDHSTLVITGPMNFVPIFEEKNVKEAVVSEEYLIGQNTSFKGKDEVIYSGYMLSLKDGYTLQGKITLPAMFKGIQVIGVYQEGFKDQNLITHVF